jgi:polyhydroxyalkanoate synthase subunit PhaC
MGMWSLSILVSGLLLWLGLRLLARRLSRPMRYATEERIAMPDGALIELRRLRVPSDAPADDCPVLMIHGLAMNHRNHDHEEASLARYLCEQGRDVWLLTLRSGQSRLSLFGPAHSGFAAMAEHDVPLAVARVLARTGKQQLDLACFSMGGMLLYASLARALDATHVRRAVLIGAPARIRPLGALSLAAYLPAALTPNVPMRLGMRMLAAAPPLVPASLRARLYNPRNLTAAAERSMLWNIWEDIPGRLGADFVRWSARGGELTVRGMPVLAGLADVTVPACFFAGSHDWLAPPETVRAGYEAWGSAVGCEKHFVLLGRKSGAQEDYGHCDLSVGRNARAELFEPAAHFLASGELVLRARTTEVAREASAVTSGAGIPAQ